MTTGEQTQTTKRRRNRAAVQPILLQERDLDMLLSISVGRYLSVPAIEGKQQRLAQIDGQPPLLHDLPPGDAFAPRSPLAFAPADALIRPELVEVEERHWVQLSRASVADFARYAHLVSY